MTNRVICTDLWCSTCQTETAHTLFYVDDHYLKTIACSVCQHIVERPIRELRREYIHDLPARAYQMVWRNVRFAYHHPRDFVVHLPRNLVIKPLALSSELHSLLSH